MIVGIDEVGRGAWAGPLVVAAVGLGGVTIDGLTDSKLLSKKRRELLALQVKQTAPLVGIGWVSATDLDKIGLTSALKLATHRAFQQISNSPDIEQIIIDGTIALIDDPRVTLMKKADLLIPSVSAASIVAKVARDHYMAACDVVFPGYGFAGHVGYGAAKHKAAIDELGVLRLHRASFAPIVTALQKNNKDSHMLKEVTKKSEVVRSGMRAELIASAALQRKGYTIIDRNWRTKWCEVDVIAQKDKVIYCVEVKYRRSLEQGGGIAAITPQKRKQLVFASQLWMHRYGNHEARISVIELSGPEFEITGWIESIE